MYLQLQQKCNCNLSRTQDNKLTAATGDRDLVSYRTFRSSSLRFEHSIGLPTMALKCSTNRALIHAQNIQMSNLKYTKS
jgi:hypothetical protein